MNTVSNISSNYIDLIAQVRLVCCKSIDIRNLISFTVSCTKNQYRSEFRVKLTAGA